MSNAPTLINLPPPPSDPVTPSDMPGTPNSATTSMSELSTVAIKDGHRGHFAHHNHPQDAERADRISRLAGLERLTAGRQPGFAGGGLQGIGNQPPGYFDQNNQPQIFRERSTVGSASATGSVGGRTTWASGSDVYDPDKMSEDQDNETSSVGGMSDEASLVGFGEGARTPARQQSNFGSPVIGKATAVPAHLREQAATSPMTGISVGSAGTSQTSQSTEAQRQDARMIDGMTYDPEFVDTANRTPPSTYMENTTGAETAQRLFNEHIGGTGRPGQEALSVDDKGLGKFPFEGKK